MKHTTTTFRAIETTPVEIGVSPNTKMELMDFDMTVNEVVKAIQSLVGDLALDVRRVENGTKTFFLVAPKTPNYEEEHIE